MNNNNVNFNLGVPLWANPADFGGGKKIAIMSFQRLSRDKGETTAKFVDKEGCTYRLTFVDMDNSDKVRRLEVHAVGFKNDLASCVRREFSTDVVPVGQPVLLRVYKEERESPNGGSRAVNRWELKKLDLPLVPIPTQVESGLGANG